MISLKRLYTRLFIIPYRHVMYMHYTLVDLLLRNQYPDIKVLSDYETIKLIIQENKSISRFGDGEINWILGTQKGSFQNSSEKLSQRLSEVLSSNLDELLVCLPATLNTMKGLDINGKHFWSKTMYHQRFHIFHHTTKDTYGNSLFTRPYMIYKDKKNAKEKFDRIKLIWENRDIVIIEGTCTYFGIENDLLENAKSVSRIIAPQENAFEKYEVILDEAKKLKKSTLILLALGPSATILAYDLTKLGYQAIDIGHVDIEYEWYIRNTKKKIPIPGKYVNEITNKIDDEHLYQENELFKKSIITKINGD